MAIRSVIRSADFLAQAESLFPRGGSVEGRPSFEIFEQGPLRGAATAFAMAFERQRQHIDGVGSIRYVLIAPTTFFGPLVISACLLRNDTIEMVSVIEDEDYWELIAGDPEQ